MIDWAGARLSQGPARVIEVLVAIAEGPGQPLAVVDLVDSLGWPQRDVAEALRGARMLGLVTGTVSNRSTVDIDNVRLTSKAQTLLRVSLARDIGPG